MSKNKKNTGNYKSTTNNIDDTFDKNKKVSSTEENCPYANGQNMSTVSKSNTKHVPCNLRKLRIVENHYGRALRYSTAQSVIRTVNVLFDDTQNNPDDMELPSGGVFAVTAGKKSESGRTELTLTVEGSGWCGEHPAIHIAAKNPIDTVAASYALNVWQNNTYNDTIASDGVKGFALSKTDLGVLIEGIWSQFVARTDLPYTVTTCGIPAGKEEAVSSLGGVIAVYTDDVYALKLNTPAYSKGELGKKGGERYTDENKKFYGKASEENDWKLELSCKSQDLTSAADFAKYFNLARKIEKSLTDVTKFIKDYRPGPGFYIGGSAAIMAGELSVDWKYTEPTDRPFVVLEIGVAAKLTLLAVEIEGGGGFNFLGFAADLFLKVEGAVGVEAAKKFQLIRPEGLGTAPKGKEDESGIKGAIEVKGSLGLRGETIIIKVEISLVLTLEGKYSLKFALEKCPVRVHIHDLKWKDLRAVGTLQGLYFKRGFDTQLIDYSQNPPLGEFTLP